MSQLLDVSLAECLEVKDAALDETELWAILTQTLERIDDLFTDVDVTRLGEMLPITPDTILLCPNGQTDLNSSHKNSKFYEDCLPPEYLSNILFNNEHYEKMFIFSLGMSIYYAADYNLTSNQDLNISSELDEFLSSMCSKNPTSRINLEAALKACSGNFMSITPVLELHRMVLGQTDVEMHPVEEKSYDYSYEVFHSNKIPNKSQVPSEANTIHYILLDRGLNARSSWRSDVTFNMERPKTNEVTDGRAFDVTSVPSEADIEESFTRLNDRRRKLESLRKGLRKLDNDDISVQSVRLSTLGFHTNQSTLNSIRTLDRHPMNFLSVEYDWLDKRAKEIDDWRRNHLKTKEMIITPDPIIRETDVQRDPIIREADVRGDLKAPQMGGFEILHDDKLLDTGASMDRPHYVTSQTLENQSFREISYVNNLLKEQSHPIKIDEEVQTKIVDLTDKVDESMVGPEFRRSYPTANLMIREASLISESNIRNAKVRLLNGSEVDVICCPSNTCGQLLECITAFLSLKEPHLFGLAAPKDNELQFIDKQLELRKVASLDWSDKKFRNRQASVLFLHFCVQYFVPSLSYLMYRSTLHLFYLQLRQHLLSERFQINDIPSNFSMAALALQAEYGSREDTKDNFSINDYLPPRVVRKSGEIACRSLLLNRWRGISEIPQKDAERIFVEKCMTFADYGHHFYRVSRVNNVSSSINTWIGIGLPVPGIVVNNMSSSKNTWIGIGLPGIVVGRDLEESRVLEFKHQWNNTLKVSYNRHRFSISDNSNKENYYTDSYRKCKYLLWLASAQHYFKLVPKVPLGRNHVGFINDVAAQPNVTKTADSRNELQNVKSLEPLIFPNKTQDSVIHNLPQEPSFQHPQTDGVDVQPSTQNKFPVKNIELPKFNFDDITRNPSNPPQLTNTSQGRTFKSEETSYNPLTLPVMRNDSEIDIQLNTQNKLLNYLQDNSQIDLPTFEFETTATNKLNPSQIKERNLSLDTPTKPEILPPPPFATSRNPGSLNLKPPVKAPRIFTDSQSMTYETVLPQARKFDEEGVANSNISLPAINVNEFSNQSGIPTSSGIKLNPLFQDEETSSFSDYQVKTFEDTNETTKKADEKIHAGPPFIMGRNYYPPSEAKLDPSNDTGLDDTRLNDTRLNESPKYTPKSLMRSSPFKVSPSPSIRIIETPPFVQTREKYPVERIKLTLERNPPEGYGIGLARDRKHEGVFVVSLMPGGVADLDGRLAPGDEIKTVNGEDVSGSDGYPKAIQLLSDSIATLEVERQIITLNRPTNENTPASQFTNEKTPIPPFTNETSVSVADIFGCGICEPKMLLGVQNLVISKSVILELLV